MATTAQLILAEVETTIKAIPLLAPVTINGELRQRVYRSRSSRFAQEELPACRIVPGLPSVIQTVRGVPLGKLSQTLRVLIEVSIQAEIPDAALDPYVEAIHLAMMADVTLGGYAMNIDPAGIDYGRDDADLGMVSMAFDVWFRTQKDDIRTTA